MKNPIILKDLLIGVNNIIWKVTIISILFLVGLFTILANNFWINIGTSSLPNYFSNDEFILIWYILWGWGIFILSLIKGIIGMCFEKSQMTYELIKISKISETKYILGKFLANLLYFSLILVMLLPFAVMNSFIGGFSVWDILLLCLHILLMWALGGALWIVIWLIGQTITLSFLISVGGAIFIWIMLDWSSHLRLIAESFMFQEDKKWVYSLLTTMIAIIWLLIYAIQKIKQETNKHINRYPVILSIILFTLAIFQIIYIEFNAYYLLLLVWIIDVMLFFLNTENFKIQNKKRFLSHIWINFLIIFLSVWYLEFLSWKLLAYILLLQILVILVSMNTTELYKNINIYLQKFLYIIILLFVTLIVPHFITNVKYYNPLQTINLYIPPVELTYKNIFISEKNKDLWIIEQDIKNLNNENKNKKLNRNINTYYYIYFLIFIMLLLHFGMYYFRKQ